MVSYSKELKSSDSILRLNVDENGWCQVELVIGDLDIRIGADVEFIVKERLAKGLQDEVSEDISGEILGVPVRWILSLSEKHFTVYASDDAGKRTLFFQTPDGEIVGNITLEPEQRKQWLSFLNHL